MALSGPGASTSTARFGDGTRMNRELADGSGKQFVPVRANGINGVTAIAAGNAHSVALKSDGTVWAWGNTGNGQLGDWISSIECWTTRTGASERAEWSKCDCRGRRSQS